MRIISRPVRADLESGPRYMLVSSGGCWVFRSLFCGIDEGEQGPALRCWMERPFTGHSLPAWRVNGTVMRGSSADTWVSVNMLTAITVPNGLTSPLLLALSVLLPFSLPLSVSLAPAVLLWHCEAVKTFNRRWMRNPCVKGEGGRTRGERKRGQKGHVLPPSFSPLVPAVRRAGLCLLLNERRFGCLLFSKWAALSGIWMQRHG